MIYIWNKNIVTVSVSGGTQRLARAVGAAKAKELIFAARVFDGAEGEKMGMVNHAVPQNEAGDAAYQRSLELAREILPNVSIVIDREILPNVSIVIDSQR